MTVSGDRTSVNDPWLIKRTMANRWRGNGMEQGMDFRCGLTAMEETRLARVGWEESIPNPTACVMAAVETLSSDKN